jgi:hypothetical protein
MWAKKKKKKGDYSRDVLHLLMVSHYKVTRKHIHVKRKINKRQAESISEKAYVKMHACIHQERICFYCVFYVLCLKNTTYTNQEEETEEKQLTKTYQNTREILNVWPK